MKLFVVPALALFATTSFVSADTASTTFPGRCLTNADCATYGKNLACIAVDSATAGLEKLNMCIPTDNICSGSIAGVCPTFSSWPSKYRKVMSVCAFQVAPNCNKQINVNPSTGSASGGGGDVNDAGVGSLSANETVECYTRNFTAGTDSKVINGIYQCMDARKYISTNGGHLKNLTETQIKACGGTPTDTDPTLCNGQGTCAPKTAFAQEYECKCNKGYDGDKYCATVTSNECSNLGQCGALGTCTLSSGSTSGTCTCKDGSKGNQCNTCDSSKGSAACNDNGKCDATTGKCTCNSGYTGTFCSDVATTTGGGGDGGSMAVSLQTVGATLATLAAMGVMVFA